MLGTAVMLCSRASQLPTGDGWAYEPKWDGFRAVVEVTHEGVRITSRHGTDFTHRVPELLTGIADAPANTVLDGELVVCGPDGRPDFFALSRRMWRREATSASVCFVAFDLPRLRGRDLAGMPYRDRRAALLGLNLARRWHVTPSIDDGSALWQAVLDNRLEGVVAKRVHSAYYHRRRSAAWVKMKNRQRAEVVVGGWQPAGDEGICRLLVGSQDGATGLRYVGAVEIGLGGRRGSALRKHLTGLETSASPFLTANEEKGRTRWVTPLTSVTITYGPPPHSGWIREAALVGVACPSVP